MQHIDARMAGVFDGRTALVRLDDVALLLSADWGDTFVVVPRAAGVRRRLFLVRVRVPLEHKDRPFDRARTVTLYDNGSEPLMGDDFGGVHSRDQESVTLAWFIADEPGYVLGGVGAEPSRASLTPTAVAPAPRPSKRG